MPYLYDGGAERVTAALAGFINSVEGYEVHLITYYRDVEKEYPIQSDIVWHSLNKVERNSFKRITEKIRYIRTVIREIKPDCVISLAGPEMLPLVTVAVRGLGIPLIFSERNDPKRFPSAKHLRLLRLWTYRKSRTVVFQTREAMSFFPKDIQKKGMVISNPLTRGLPQRYEGKRLPKIVTSCRLDSQKNIDLLIDSFNEVLQQFSEYTLYIYGEGTERLRLEKKVYDMGLSDKVFLPGYSNRIFDEIIQASLFVLSSDYEGISNSMLEAIALGVPTIATDCPVGGARETIIHGENGMLVPVRNQEEMVRAMIKVLSDAELSERISKNGSKLRDKLDISCIAGQWLDLVENVIVQSK